jgi:hypothetical protein
MRPYIETSFNEQQRPEITIHALSMLHVVVLEELLREYKPPLTPARGDAHIAELKKVFQSFLVNPTAHIKKTA